MTATWPAINTTQYGPLQVLPVEQRATFAADLGPPITAPLATKLATIHRCEMRFTGDELSVFQSWLEVDLACGSDDFTGLEDLVGDAQAIFQFRTLPVYSVLRGGSASTRLWRATFELLRVPSP